MTRGSTARAGWSGRGQAGAHDEDAGQNRVRQHGQAGQLRDAQDLPHHDEVEHHVPLLVVLIDAAQPPERLVRFQDLPARPAHLAIGQARCRPSKRTSATRPAGAGERAPVAAPRALVHGHVPVGDRQRLQHLDLSLLLVVHDGNPLCVDVVRELYSLLLLQRQLQGRVHAAVARLQVQR